jgi:carbonic anhydrase
MSATTINVPKEAAPAALVNATLALFPVLGGFLAQNLLVGGELKPTTLLILVFAIQNLCLCYFWRRLKSLWVKQATLLAVISCQWSYIGIAVYSLYAPLPTYGSYAHILSLAMVVGALALFIARLGWERSGSAALFAVIGLFSMVAIIWRGIEDWSVAVSALSGRQFTETAADKRGVAGDRWQNASKEGAGSKEGQFHWDYSGEFGPDMWGSIKNEFKTCGAGMNQSPVDIPKRSPTLKDGVRLQWNPEKGSVVNNGHTIQVNLTGHSSIKIAGQSYVLKHFHIHTPSEHQVSGLSYPMEIQFVHATPEGKLAVLGVFVEIGAVSEEFGKIMPSMPASADSSPTETSTLNLASILPKDVSVFRYSGSLTTPPCSEGVLWSVLREPIEMSSEQVTAFRRLFSSNARPVQPMGARAFEGRLPSLAH